ncbi:MAG: hypothetical protein GY863_04525, partial [bacterium]|nr:hypothetical protein [bacterium]
FRGKDIYTGKELENMPDIALMFDGTGFAIDYEAAPGKEVFFIDHRNSGHHRLNSVLGSYGPDIDETKGDEAVSIFDIFPTAMHMLGLPVPKNGDGKVLTELFKEGSELKKKEIKYIDIKDDEESEREDSEEDKEEVMKRLKNLGYI